VSGTSQCPDWWLATGGGSYPPHAELGSTPAQVPELQSSLWEQLSSSSATGWTSPALPVQARLGLHPQQVPELRVLRSTGFIAPTDAFNTHTATMRMARPTTVRTRIPAAVAWIAAGIFLITTIVVGTIAYQQSSSTNQWRQADERALSRLARAHSVVAFSMSQVSNLKRDVHSLNGQLPEVASAKQRALAQLAKAQSTIALMETQARILKLHIRSLDDHRSTETRAKKRALGQLAAAQLTITSLGSQISALNGQVGILNSQLSADAAAQKRTLAQLAAAQLTIVTLDSQISAFNRQVRSLTRPPQWPEPRRSPQAPVIGRRRSTRRLP
jgi:hypothetical protein